MRSFCLASLGAAALTLSACGGPIRVDDPQLVASPDKVSMMLAQAADRSSTALETLAAVEQKRTPQASVAPIPNAPAELRRAVTVNWIGPADQITKMMADRAGYRFIPLGTAPAVPMVVSINVENKPVIDILRSIGLQLGTRADVRVDSDRRVIEMQYVSVAGPGDVAAQASDDAHKLLPDLSGNQ